MAGNVTEWSTETGININSSSSVSRSGDNNDNYEYTSNRLMHDTSYSHIYLAFRTIIYL